MEFLVEGIMAITPQQGVMYLVGLVLIWLAIKKGYEPSLLPPMGAGAILSARIARVVYGARDPKTGTAGSIADLFAMPYPHRPDLTSGLLAPECQALLDRFFAHLRGRNEQP